MLRTARSPFFGSALPPPRARIGAPLSRATVAARQKIFGKNNVDPRTGRVRGDKVIFSWTAVAVESSSLEWKVGYLRVQDAMGVLLDKRPELMWLVDPNDYLRPLVLDPRDDRWRKRGGRHED